VTLEVRLHRLVMGENGRRESGKNSRVGNARRRIRILFWRRGDLGGFGSTASRKVKMVVERLEKIMGLVRRGGESERDVGVGVTLEVSAPPLQEKLKWW